MTEPTTDIRRTAFDKTFKKPDGSQGVVQVPNYPLFIWIVATIIAFFLHGAAHTIVSGIAAIALIYWAVLELVKGVDWFRRVLGGVVLVLSLADFVMLLIHK